MLPLVSFALQGLRVVYVIQQVSLVAIVSSEVQQLLQFFSFQPQALTSFVRRGPLVFFVQPLPLASFTLE